MIDSIGLENFKAIKSRLALDLRPLTILCGSNSCGKSSILQSVLLLKQTIESQGPGQILLANGRLAHLGSLENIVYDHDETRDVHLEYVFPLNSGSPNQVRTGTTISPFVVRHLVRGGQMPPDGLQLRLSVSLSSRSSGQYRKGLKPTVVESFKAAVENHGSNSNGDNPWPQVSLTRDDVAKTYIIEWHNIEDPYTEPESHTRTVSSGGTRDRVKFSHLFPISFSRLGGTSRSSPLGATFARVYRWLTYAREVVRFSMGSINYLGPLREEPARRYVYEDEVVEVGVKGENAAYLYMLERNRKLGDYLQYDEESGGFTRRHNVKFGRAVDDNLSAMGIENLHSKTTENGIISLMMSAQVGDATPVNIADVGFGVSQVFPIVVAGLRTPVGSCLMLEQPEIHLHPKLQMQMADFLLSLAQTGRQVLVETHSDHVVNRLVRRIVEDPSGELARLVGIYFIEASAEGSQAQEVQVDAERGIVNWPQGFFDQAPNEQVRIIEAGLQKRLHASNG
jgi:predicted ATPase